MTPCSRPSRGPPCATRGPSPCTLSSSTSVLITRRASPSPWPGGGAWRSPRSRWRAAWSTERTQVHLRRRRRRRKRRTCSLLTSPTTDCRGCSRAEARSLAAQDHAVLAETAALNQNNHLFLCIVIYFLIETASQCVQSAHTYMRTHTRTSSEVEFYQLHFPQIFQSNLPDIYATLKPSSTVCLKSECHSFLCNLYYKLFIINLQLIHPNS